MSPEEMRRTGIDQLDYPQQLDLEAWLNENFVLKSDCGGKKRDKPIFLTLNHHKGLFLEFSDTKTYKIAPDDRFYAAYWMTPFPAEFSYSGDDDYPVKITNLNTNTAVRGIEVSTREILKEEVDASKNGPSIPSPVQPTQPTQQPQSPRSNNPGGREEPLINQ